MRNCQRVVHHRSSRGQDDEWSDTVGTKPDDGEHSVENRGAAGDEPIFPTVTKYHVARKCGWIRQYCCLASDKPGRVRFTQHTGYQTSLNTQPAETNAAMRIARRP